jgi:alcohol dehydrogenase
VTQRIEALVGADAVLYDRARSNPTFNDLDEALQSLQAGGFARVVAIGGGSAIDMAKAIAIALPAGVTDAGSMVDLAAGPLAAQRPLPLTAVPTTAGTGSEVTPFATIWDGVTKRKQSIGTSLMHPTRAVVDPELALSLPWPPTLSSGLDAFSQCFEAICNRNATPLTTAFAQRGLQLIPDALQALSVDLSSVTARSAMAEAALLSGLAISVTRTGLAHSISYPLTAHFGVPHGLACATSLPFVLSFNADADDGSLGALASTLHVDGPSGVVSYVLALYAELGVREAIQSHLPASTSLASLRAEMVTPGRADNNVRDVHDEDLERILDAVQSWLATGIAP